VHLTRVTLEHTEQEISMRADNTCAPSCTVTADLVLAVGLWAGLGRLTDIDSVALSGLLPVLS